MYLGYPCVFGGTPQFLRVLASSEAAVAKAGGPLAGYDLIFVELRLLLFRGKVRVKEFAPDHRHR